VMEIIAVSSSILRVGRGVNISAMVIDSALIGIASDSAAVEK